MVDWLAMFEVARVRDVIVRHKVSCRQFRILAKHKLRDDPDHFGFLPKKRRKKLYEELVKYVYRR